MKKFVFLVFLFISSKLLAQGNLPFSKEALFKESYSPTEVTIKASGIGKNVDLAEIDAQKASIFFVLFLGTDPILSTSEEKARFNKIDQKFFRAANIRNYISYMAPGVIKRIKTRRGIKIQKLIRVNTKKLTEDLVSLEIVMSKGDLQEAVGNPFIMVLPEVSKGQNPLKVLSKPNIRKGGQVIESYLTARQYEVIIPEQIQTISQLTEAQSGIKGIDNDISYQLAMSIGSDVYITYTIEIVKTYSGKKGVVGCRAYETTTARLLGTETGYSRERPGAASAVLIEEAMNDAIEKVLHRINKYWKKDIDRGRQYKIVFKFLDQFEDPYEIIDTIDDILSETTTKRRQIIATERTVDYVIWQKKYKTASKMFRRINKKVKATGEFLLKRINLNRKLLLIGIKSAG